LATCTIGSMRTKKTGWKSQSSSSSRAWRQMATVRKTSKLSRLRRWSKSALALANRCRFIMSSFFQLAIKFWTSSFGRPLTDCYKDCLLLFPNVSKYDIDACCLILWNLVNLELQEACINQMVGRQALLVQKCLAEDGQPHLPLDRISTMFRYLRRPKNQVAHEATVRQLLPLLADCLNKWQADYRIVERICKCLRFIIR